MSAMLCYLTGTRYTSSRIAAVQGLTKPHHHFTHQGRSVMAKEKKKHEKSTKANKRNYVWYMKQTNTSSAKTRKRTRTSKHLSWPFLLSIATWDSRGGASVNTRTSRYEEYWVTLKLCEGDSDEAPGTEGREQKIPRTDWWKGTEREPNDISFLSCFFTSFITWKS